MNHVLGLSRLEATFAGLQESDEGHNDALAFGVAAMQGWRVSMVRTGGGGRRRRGALGWP